MAGLYPGPTVVLRLLPLNVPAIIRKMVFPPGYTVSQSNMLLCLIEKRNPRQDVAAKRHPLNGIAALRMATAALCEAFRRQGGTQASAAAATSKPHGCCFDVEMVLLISALKSKLFSAEDRHPKNVVFG
jgi:hypothetical protein